MTQLFRIVSPMDSGTPDECLAAHDETCYADSLIFPPHPLAEGQNCRCVAVPQVSVREALIELVTLKTRKDKLGKTDEYQQRQPVAWLAACDALEREEPLRPSEALFAVVDWLRQQEYVHPINVHQGPETIEHWNRLMKRFCDANGLEGPREAYMWKDPGEL